MAILARRPHFILALLLASVLAGGFMLTSKGSSQTAPQAGAPPNASGSTVVKRTILPDGTIQFEYADGTTRRVPPESSASPTDDALNSKNTAGDSVAPAEPPPWLKDAATNQAFLSAMREYYAYRQSGLQHRRRVFEWQLVSSKFIFFTVLILVTSGIVFAALQFGAGLKRTKTESKETTTEIDLSATGIKVSSPVLGVIILVISLAFFYLYLIYVYPISELV